MLATDKRGKQLLTSGYPQIVLIDPALLTLLFPKCAGVIDTCLSQNLSPSESEKFL